jgi:TetR/AcrR family transcriptional regulator, transcriptional repressor of bet genes
VRSISNLRRHELEKATYEVVDLVGVRQLTIQRVAAHAGVSKGIAHHYFQNKDELLFAAVRHAHRLFDEYFIGPLRSTTSPSERLWVIIHIQLSEEFLSFNYLRTYLSVLEAGFFNKKIRNIYSITDRRGRSNLAFALRSLMHGKEVQSVASTIWSFIEGAWLLLPGWSETTRSEILSAIKLYLISSVPGFDASVTHRLKAVAPRAEQKTTRLPTSTIRRMELEKAALDILYENGFRELTVQRVAEKAQLSKGVVHHYFLSKDDLVAGALRHEFREFGTAVAQLLRKASTPSERLWIVITTQLADQYLQFSYLRWYLNSLEAGFRSKGISQVYDIAERRGRSNIAAALKGLMPAAAARKTTLVLWSMIEGSCYLLFSDRSITRKDVLLELANYLTNSIPAFDASVVIIDGARAYEADANSIEREKIHKAVVEVMAHVSYRNLTFELVAEHLGIPVDAIHRHFQSFGDLTAATIRYATTAAAKNAEGRRQQANSASEALWALVYTEVEPTFMVQRLAEIYVSLLEAGMEEREILDTYENVDEMSVSAIASELRRLMPGDAAEVVLANLRAMVDGAWRLLPGDPGTTQSAIIAAISEYLVKAVPSFDVSVLKLSAQWSEESGASVHP